ncbi:hypothetical protein DL93DRAFT_2073070 [Clavulina sp. PMI_390]|nr:hypothetical protein DL93DRAFT_2073070 [Clavulina sp. PMI_390]
MVWHRAKTTVISASAWFREEPSFLWSEGSVVFVGHTDEQPRGQKGAGKYELYYDFQRILHETSENVEEQNIKVVINDLLVIPGDRLLILTVALVVDEEDDYATRNPEHRVIIFNLKKKKIESFFATFDDVNKISIHKSGMFVVISRHTRPPTVYELKHLSTPAKRPWFDPVLTCEAAPELEFIGVSFLASVLPEGGQTVMSATKGAHHLSVLIDKTGLTL